MQDFKVEAEQMWKKPEIRGEFSEIENLVAYLQNKDRVKTYQGKKSTKADNSAADHQADRPKAAGLDDSALKAKWNASKALQNEFGGNYESYRQYMLNKNRVKVWN